MWILFEQDWFNASETLVKELIVLVNQAIHAAHAEESFEQDAQFVVIYPTIVKEHILDFLRLLCYNFG